MKTITINDDVEAITIDGLDFLVEALKEIAKSDPFTLFRFKHVGNQMIMYSYTVVSDLEGAGNA